MGEGLNRFSEETTLHGLPHLLDKRSPIWLRALWVIMLLIALITGFCIIGITIQNFVDAPKVSSISFERLDKGLENVSMSVCPKHVLNVSKILEERPNLIALSYAFLALNDFYAQELYFINTNDLHPMSIFRYFAFAWNNLAFCFQHGCNHVNRNESMTRSLFAALRQGVEGLIQSIGGQNINDLFDHFTLDDPNVGCGNGDNVCNKRMQFKGKEVLENGRICYLHTVAAVGERIELTVREPFDIQDLYYMSVTTMSDTSENGILLDTNYDSWSGGGLLDKAQNYHEKFYLKRYQPAAEILQNLQSNATEELNRLNDQLWISLDDGYHPTRDEWEALKEAGTSFSSYVKQDLENRAWLKMEYVKPPEYRDILAAISETEISLQSWNVNQELSMFADTSSSSSFKITFKRQQLIPDAENGCTRNKKRSETQDRLSNCQHQCFNEKIDTCLNDTNQQSEQNPPCYMYPNVTRFPCASLGYEYYWPDNSTHLCLANLWQACGDKRVGRELKIDSCYIWCDKYEMAHSAGAFSRWLLERQPGGTFVLDFRGSDKITVVSEVTSFTWDSLVGNIGGLLGLTCGASLISIVHLVYFICCSRFYGDEKVGSR